MLRYREKGSIDTSRVSIQQDQYSGCSADWRQLSSQSLFGVGERRTFNDNVTAKFSRKASRGEIIFNPMKSTYLKAEPIAGSGTVYRWNVPHTCSGVPTYQRWRNTGPQGEVLYGIAAGMAFPFTGDRIPMPASVISDKAVHDLIVEAQTSVLASRGRMDNDIWEMLAESDEILGTFTGLFKNARNVIISKGPPALVSNATASYLAWRYGVSPLIKDVNAVLDGLKKKTGKMRKTSRSQTSDSSYSTASPTYSNGTVAVNFLSQNFDDVTVRAMSLDELVTSYENNIGFTSKGLVTLPWELVPYSFVADWFVNFGDFLGAMVPAFGWNQLGSCVTVKRVQMLVYQTVSTTYNASYTMEQAYSGGFRTHYETKYRTVGLGAPGVTLKSDFRFRNLTRCLDAFSLLAQLVLKRK